MKKWILILGYLSLAVFGGGTSANTVAEHEMPFGLVIAPDTRIVRLSTYLVGNQQEANGSLATKGTAKEVVTFYERALKDAGFRIFSKTDNAKRVSIAGKRGKGDYFSVSNSGDGDGVEAGETELRILFRLAP